MKYIICVRAKSRRDEPEHYERAHRISNLMERYNKVCLISALERKTFRELLEMIRLMLFVKIDGVDSMGIENYFGERYIDG